jgi:cytochrome c553
MKWSVIGKIALSYAFAFSIFTAMNVAQATPDKKGAVLFKLCTSCHGMKGEGRQNLGAPQIAGLPAWYVIGQIKNFRNRARGNHPGDFYGLRMAPMARTLRSEADIELVAKHVESLPSVKQDVTLTGGDAKNGEALFATCSACHGPDAKGNKDMMAPSLHISGDWYLFRQIKAFQKGYRGKDATKDPFGATMAPMAMTLVDDQAILDVLAFIQTLEK